MTTTYILLLLKIYRLRKLFFDILLNEYFILGLLCFHQQAGTSHLFFKYNTKQEKYYYFYCLIGSHEWKHFQQDEFWWKISQNICTTSKANNFFWVFFTKINSEQQVAMVGTKSRVCHFFVKKDKMTIFSVSICQNARFFKDAEEWNDAVTRPCWIVKFWKLSTDNNGVTKLLNAP